MTAATKTQESGRSIPDKVLEVIDEVWGEEIPSVRTAVRRLWGVPVKDIQAMKYERQIAKGVHEYTMRKGKVLTPKEARILLMLAPCLDVGPYGIGEHWVDISGAAKLLGLSEAHVRRMIINDKIDLTMIRRPSSGNLAKKRWIMVDSLM